MELFTWPNVGEGKIKLNMLIDSLERYKDKNGFYPDAVLADKIYRNQ